MNLLHYVRRIIGGTIWVWFFLPAIFLLRYIPRGSEFSPLPEIAPMNRVVYVYTNVFVYELNKDTSHMQHDYVVIASG